ncbi:hypothetical protein CRYPA_1575 [uncultured Candidatus Thioglobus sp.]|nr:hypothetical protein CRYPA_1575 [uncultured Candidatus Thioglobus sp.]
MNLFSTIVDTLSASASLIAILVVLGAWLNSVRSPLKIVRVVIHRKEDESTYILLVKNRLSHTVVIKNMRCFTHRNYRVEQKNNCAPEYHPELSYSDSPFTSNKEKEILGKGHTDIRYTYTNYTKDINQLLFSMDTTHGFLTLKCKNIEIVSMGSVQTYDLEFVKNYDNKYKALKTFFWLKVKYCFRSKTNN